MSTLAQRGPVGRAKVSRAVVSRRGGRGGRGGRGCRGCRAKVSSTAPLTRAGLPRGSPARLLLLLLLLLLPLLLLLLPPQGAR